MARVLTLRFSKAHSHGSFFHRGVEHKNVLRIATFSIILIFKLNMPHPDTFEMISIAVAFSFVLYDVIHVFYRQKYLKRLGCFVEEMGFNFSTDRKDAVFRNQYNKFQSIQENQIGDYFISGIVQGNYFEYYEINSWFKKYSTITIDADRYQKNFEHILIKRQWGLRKQKDIDLEWNDFNAVFDNRFNEPRQALEIVTPTFMEKLFAISRECKEIKFEYFETPEYQKHTFVIIFRPALFSKNKEGFEGEILKLKKAVEMLISLKESV
jgi:hypothetical protein